MDLGELGVCYQELARLHHHLARLGVSLELTEEWSRPPAALVHREGIHCHQLVLVMLVRHLQRQLQIPEKQLEACDTADRDRVPNLP